MYSNCLFEALKAKLKNWKNVKIFSIPKAFNQGHFHFFWLDKSTNTVNHFSALNEKHCNLLFKGKYKKVSLENFEYSILRLHRFVNYTGDKVKLAKRLQLPSVNQPGYLDWEPFNTIEPELYADNFPKKTKVVDSVIILANGKIYNKNIDDVTKDELEENMWMYISPYQELYWRVLKDFKGSFNI